MKKIVSFFFVFTICIMCVGCNKMNKTKTLEPETSRMKTILELATMDCYYHNVAKYNQKDATGALWWKKDRNFWIEYAGVVRIGIDITLVSMDVDGDTVTITIPQAKVLSCTVDEATLTKESFIVAKDSAKVEATHQIEALKEAQSRMEQSASEDTVLLLNAQQRAQSLLEDYVNNIGNLIGKEYKFKWIYLEDNN